MENHANSHSTQKIKTETKSPDLLLPKEIEAGFVGANPEKSFVYPMAVGLNEADTARESPNRSTGKSEKSCDRPKSCQLAAKAR